MSSDHDHCRGCDRPVDEVGPLSQRRLCEPCSETRQLANTRAMIDRRGPFYDRWRVGMARSVGAELPDLEVGGK